jgi:hypothetical protein
MAKLNLDIPPEDWRAVVPFLHHHIGHMEPSPLNPDPMRVLKHLEEAIRAQFEMPEEKAVQCFIDSQEVDCETFKQTESLTAEKILTDPDLLAKYTCEFFGENGPYPVSEHTP